VWLDYLDAMATERTSSSGPHTLSVQHEVSVEAGKQLLTSPPSRSWRILAQGKAALDAAVGLQWANEIDGVVPPQVELSVKCYDWATSVRPFTRFALRYCHNIRSIRLGELPQQEQVTARLLMAVSHCSNLETLYLAASPNCAPWPDEPATELEWAMRPHRLARLHTLVLTGVMGAEADVCRILSASPSLRKCVLDPSKHSMAMLRVLAACCPLLSRLQLLVRDMDALIAQINVSREEPQPVVPFRSLLKLDVLAYGVTSPHDSAVHWASLCDALRSSPVAGSPLGQLGMTLWYRSAQHQPAIAPLLLALPRLEKLWLTSGDRSWVGEELSTLAWDQEEHDEEDDSRAQHRAALAIAEATRRPSESVPPPSLLSVSSLTSLDTVVSAFLPIEHFVALLRYCPAVTSIKLTIHAADGLLTFLHCLAHIGRHCPLIERITFALDFSDPRAAASGVQLFSVMCVGHVVNQHTHDMPADAFASLRSVCRVGRAAQVLSKQASLYVRQRWMSTAREDAVLDWQAPPSQEDARMGMQQVV